MENQELIDRLKQENEELSNDVSDLEERLSSLQETVDGLTEERDGLASERDELVEFKEEVEAERERAHKIEFIRELFSENGVELPEDYFEDEERAEKLLSASTDQIEFLVQEMAVFASREDEEAGASRHLGSRNRAPNLGGEGTDETDLTPREIAQALHEDLESAREDH